MDYANGSYESYYGTIASNWAMDADKLSTYKCAVPANTTATLFLPVESVGSLKTVYGAEYKGMTTRNGLTVAEFALLSGRFDFTLEDGNVVVSYTGYYYSKADLAAAIARYQSLSQSDWTNETWAIAAQAYAAASEVNDDEAVTRRLLPRYAPCPISR